MWRPVRGWGGWRGVGLGSRVDPFLGVGRWGGSEFGWFFGGG